MRRAIHSWARSSRASLLRGESTLLGFHHPPDSFADGGFRLGAADAKALPSVHVGVKAGFHFAYFNTQLNHTKRPSLLSAFLILAEPPSDGKERDEAG